MNHDLEARLAQLLMDNQHFTEQVATLTQQLSTAQREAQLANRLLEEARVQKEEVEKQHDDKVWDSYMCTFTCVSCIRSNVQG